MTAGREATRDEMVEVATDALLAATTGYDEQECRAFARIVLDAVIPDA